MKMFRERNPLPLGLVVVVWLVATILVVLNINGVIGMFGSKYEVMLSEAAGIRQGDPVRVSGKTVGRVGEVRLEGEGVLVEFAVTDTAVELGDETTATVSVETVLGDKALVLESAGDGELAQGSRIPVERSTVPYDVNDALSDLQREVEDIEVEKVARALTTVASTLDGVTPELTSAIDGLSRISQTISSRDEALVSLLDNADGFSEVLARRSEDLTTIMKDGNALFEALLERREDVTALLVNLSAMSTQLQGLVADNEAEIGPALEELDNVITTLRGKKAQIGKILRGVSLYATSLGEVVASGSYFNANVQNLGLPGTLLNPDLSQFGLRNILDALGGR